MKLCRTAAFVLAGSFLVASCGSDELPTKAEFTASVKKEMGAQLTQLEGAGIEKAKAEEIFDDFIGCVYDKIKDNEQLLRDAVDKSGDAAVSKLLDEKASSCVKQLTDAATSAVTGG